MRKFSGTLFCVQCFLFLFFWIMPQWTWAESQGEPSGWLQPEERKTLVRQLLTIVTENVDSYKALDKKDIQQNRYPVNRAAYIVAFLSNLPFDPAFRDEVISLARKGFIYSADITEQRYRASAQANLAKIVDLYDHAEAVRIAEKIEGLQTRERTLIDLGSSPYAEPPEDPKKLMTYYRIKARFSDDVREKAEYYMKDKQTVIAYNRDKKDHQQYFGDYEENDLEYFQKIVVVDKTLALEYVRLNRQVAILRLNEGSSNYPVERTEPEIEYIGNLAQINFDDAVKAVESIRLDFFTGEARAASYIQLARFISPTDKSRAQALLAKAKNYLKGSENIPYFEEMIRYDLKPVLVYRDPRKTEQEDNRSETEKILDAAKREEVRLLRRSYRESKDKNAFAQFIRTKIAPLVDKMEKPEVRSVWLAEIAVIYKAQGLKGADFLMTRALTLLERHGASRYMFPETGILEAYVVYDPQEAEKYILDQYLERTSNDVRFTDVFQELYRQDPRFVLDFIKMYPKRYDSSGFEVAFIGPERGEGIRLSRDLFASIALDILKNKGFDASLEFINQWNGFPLSTWDPVFEYLAEHDIQKLITMAGITEDSATRNHLAFTIASKDYRRALEILCCGDDQQKVKIISIILQGKNKKFEEALNLLGTITDPSEKLRGVLEISKILKR